MESHRPLLEAFRDRMRGHPHQQAIGFELLELTETYALGQIPYRAEFVGNPLSGVIHGGIVTTLLDIVGGAAVAGRCGQLMTMATLDLRIDYLRPSRPQYALFARVECYKLTRSVAFTRGLAYDSVPDDPLAAMTATYMLNTPTQRRGDSKEHPA
ncbi:MAG: PaaI family thioesterase [Candidatus Tectimicrobiota bacterium]